MTGWLLFLCAVVALSIFALSHVRIIFYYQTKFVILLRWACFSRYLYPSPQKIKSKKAENVKSRFSFKKIKNIPMIENWDDIHRFVPSLSCKIHEFRLIIGTTKSDHTAYLVTILYAIFTVSIDYLYQLFPHVKFGDAEIYPSFNKKEFALKFNAEISFLLIELCVLLLHMHRHDIAQRLHVKQKEAA